MKKLLLGVIFTTKFFAQEIDYQKFNDYWYSGKAEVSSYDLVQARYGELRQGHAVNIFVTEPFSPAYNTKADQEAPENVMVLKLVASKKFNTGMYPYSILTTSFLPVEKPTASLKISSSTQEWCGHEYVELTNKEQFEISNYSYFQGASFKNKKLKKSTYLENDIWSAIRLSPNKLPQSSCMMLPSFHYLRFVHKEIKPYEARLTYKMIGENKVYTINYPELERTLKITFKGNEFPFTILGWEETYMDGYGDKRKKLKTKATLKKTMLVPYWDKNKNSDAYLRKELGI